MHQAFENHTLLAFSVSVPSPMHVWQVKGIMRVGVCPQGRVFTHGCHVARPGVPSVIGTNKVPFNFFESESSQFKPIPPWGFSFKVCAMRFVTATGNSG